MALVCVRAFVLSIFSSICIINSHFGASHSTSPRFMWGLRPAGRRLLSNGAEKDGAEKDVEEAKQFLLRLRHPPEVADGIISALKSSGALLPTLYSMAGAWVSARVRKCMFGVQFAPCVVLQRAVQ